MGLAGKGKRDTKQVQSQKEVKDLTMSPKKLMLEWVIGLGGGSVMCAPAPLLSPQPLNGRSACVRASNHSRPALKNCLASFVITLHLYDLLDLLIIFTNSNHESNIIFHQPGINLILRRPPPLVIQESLR